MTVMIGITTFVLGLETVSFCSQFLCRDGSVLLAACSRSTHRMVSVDPHGFEGGQHRILFGIKVLSTDRVSIDETALLWQASIET